jgi:hypothetical protein
MKLLVGKMALVRLIISKVFLSKIVFSNVFYSVLAFLLKNGVYGTVVNKN